MKIARLLGMVALLLFAAQTAMAATYYVKAGGAGANNGSDWSNAYSSLPTSLVRGGTYYVATGNYPSYTFDDAESGTSVITVKKATQADHGTETGWQSAYGAGQAVFNSVIRFNTGYYVFDGQTRNEADWFAGSAYGIQIAHNNQDENIIIGTSGGYAASNITIKYVFINAIYQNLPSTTIRRVAIDTDTYSGPTHTNLVFSRMYVYGSGNVWLLRTTNGSIVEYSASNGVASNAANHGEIVNLFYSGNNAIVRYNIFKNAYTDGGGGGTALVAITQANGLQFYGNVMQDFNVGDGAVGFDGYTSSHNRVYNNTFIGGKGWNAGVAWGSGTDNLVYNNLWVNCTTVNLAGSHDYNGFSDSNSRGEAHAQLNVPTSLFTDYNNRVVTLTADTSAGTPLSSPYNYDMHGTLRGTGGVWDRGAFQFGSSAPVATQPNPPQNLR